MIDMTRDSTSFNGSAAKARSKLNQRHILAGIVIVLVLSVLLSALRAGWDSAESPIDVTHEDFGRAVAAPETFDGKHLTDFEFGKRLAKYLPIGNDLSFADKYQLCMSVAEDNFLETSTSVQRKNACTDYGRATAEDWQRGREAFVDFLDKMTPTQRFEFCQTEWSSLLGQGATQDELDATCDWVANEWDEARRELSK